MNFKSEPKVTITKDLLTSSYQLGDLFFRLDQEKFYLVSLKINVQLVRKHKN
jgi:hypothetical protein